MRELLGRTNVRDALAEYLTEARANELEMLSRAPEDRTTHVLQGRAAVLADLLKMVKAADRTGGTTK